jgi:predicted RNA-binding protein Jag
MLSRTTPEIRITGSPTSGFSQATVISTAINGNRHQRLLGEVGTGLDSVDTCYSSIPSQ